EVSAEVEREQDIPPQEDEQRRREDERVPVEVLDQEREPRLAGVALTDVGNRACRRRPEERAVIRAAVVIAGHAERERERDDEDRGREVPVRADERKRRMDGVRRE